MSVSATEAPVTENPNPFKLSDYAVETVVRVAAVYHLELYKHPNGHKKVENIEQIASHWHDDQQVEQLRDTYEKLGTKAKEKEIPPSRMRYPDKLVYRPSYFPDGSLHKMNLEFVPDLEAPMYDEAAEDRAIVEKLEEHIKNFRKKMQQSTSFKESLRGGGIDGQLVGTELLKGVNRDPLLLDDEIILVGSDFVLEYLRVEDEHQESMKGHPDYETFLPFIKGTRIAIKEIEQFREHVKQRQESNKLSV